ncbi:hypothetical protein PsorP6_019035 [Peronosclerospora sorghi]|nr:hypothetical protein PsorP6_019035 [Peronosclerospora sorghi]
MQRFETPPFAADYSGEAVHALEQGWTQTEWMEKQVGAEKEDAASSRDDVAALFGRVDVISHVTKDLLDKLKNVSEKGAWKLHSEALNTIQVICERAGCAVAFTRPAQHVVRFLKARLSDANANLKVKAANVLATVATRLGALRVTGHILRQRDAY